MFAHHRRQSSVFILLALVAFALGQRTLAAGDELKVLPKSIDGIAPAKMMPLYIKAKVHEAIDRRTQNFEKLIASAENFPEYQQKMRAFFVEQLGGFPEKTPLNPQIVGRLDRDGYRIEKLIYESRPGFFVTALLYLPKATPPYPGVLVPCGHMKNGKAGYQEIGILLARNGMAALCFDPIEQGERYQVFNAKGKPAFQPTTAHNRIGVGSILLGRNAASFFVWDAIRGIDYLVSRKDIDPHRIGCTGNSGGGTLTSFVMAVDDRVQCAAPSCYLTSYARLLDTIGPQDAEQHIFGQIGHGFDHADFIHMRATKPTLMCTATRDFFDIGGSWATFREAKRVYSKLGFAERVDLVENDGEHGFASPLRVAAVRWMRCWLMGIDDAITEPAASLLTDKEASCTPRGRVTDLPGAKTTYELNAEYERDLAAQRRKAWSAYDRAQQMALVRRVTGIRPLNQLPQPETKKVGHIDRKSYHIEKWIIRPEPGIWLPALLFVPDKSEHEAILYLDDRGKSATAATGGDIERLVRKGRPVLAVDLRGIGETRYKSSSRSKYADYLGEEWTENTQAYLLGTSYLKMRTEDIMVCARFLAQHHPNGLSHRVKIHASGVLGPPALHAAALEPELIDALTLRRSVISWKEVVRTPWAQLQYVNVVHGALRTYDLPDLVGSLSEGRVEIVDPRRADGKPVKKTTP